MNKKVDLQCSNCGKREEIENTVDNAVQIIKSGWDSIGGALYCPKCVEVIKNSRYGDRLAGEKNTFIAIMHWILNARNGEKDGNTDE